MSLSIFFCLKKKLFWFSYCRKNDSVCILELVKEPTDPILPTSDQELSELLMDTISLVSSVDYLCLGLGPMKEDVKNH